MNQRDRDIRRQRCRYVVSDWLTTLLAFSCFNCYRFFHMMKGEDPGDLLRYLLSSKLLAEALFVPLGLLGIYWLSGYYNRPLERSRLQEMLTTFWTAVVSALLLYLAALTNDQMMMRRENWLLIIVLFLLLFSFTYTGRLMLTNRMLRRFRERKMLVRTIVAGPRAAALKEALRLRGRQHASGMDIVGIFVTDSHDSGDASRQAASGLRIIDDFRILKEMSEEGKVDQVIIVPGDTSDKEKTILSLLHRLFPLEIAIRIKPDMLSYLTPTIRMQDIKGEPLVDITSPVASECTKNIKRSFDVFASAVALLLLSPLLASLALAVRRSSPGKAIYWQERIGLHGRPFRIYKFRTMRTDAEAAGPQLSSDDDPRITAIGKKLRKYRLDELPQFWNVLKGDMSLVGPRPERSFFIEKIMKVAPWYSLVHQVRPGITSWGMVKYGYASSVDEMVERNRYDLVYLFNMSIAVDLKIMIYTVRTVVTGKGV